MLCFQEGGKQALEEEGDASRSSNIKGVFASGDLSWDEDDLPGIDAIPFHLCV